MPKINKSRHRLNQGVTPLPEIFAAVNGVGTVLLLTLIISCYTLSRIRIPVMINEFHVFSNLNGDIENYGLGETLLDDETKSVLVDSYNEAAEKMSSLDVNFSTKDFSSPSLIKPGFIQRRIRELLSLFIKNETSLKDILIAVEEASANIFEHSYGFKEIPVIEFHFILSPSKITIIIDDFGKMGKNLKIESTGKYSSMEELKDKFTITGSGIGIYLIRKLMDFISYEVKPGKYNRFTMTKNL